MKKLSLVVTVLAMASILMTSSGCQFCKKLWPWGKKDKIDIAYRPQVQELTPPGSADGTTVSSDGWTQDGKSLPPRGQGSIVPIKDARWDGVVVYFAFDSSSVGDAEKPKLEALAQYMKENADYAVVIEGHCDERGSDEYNRGLGERRALAIRDYLVTLGIADTRFETISYGEEKPTAANASAEDQHAQNRRAEFVIGIRQ